MSPLRLIYLGLALWGAVHPMAYVIAWFSANGLSLSGLIAAWQANAASAGLLWDLAIAGIALSIWIIAEVLVRRNWTALLAIPATFLIGLGCGLPLYLFLRTRPV
ncbi:DUF2834 domain-containing protein [Pseudooceanicola sp.]|uniref:DUF2834 domain-containing protein n=1 Tax=Pseudooceanicola sp. TaxID=1914328 RepID=UPI00260D2BCC|nr:DUF2834 domain-containing protein [Pseudooceanicola sp.]MDF1855314.1 DUF2834 domain-containing protein [Pseudooceanicola sp.]